MKARIFMIKFKDLDGSKNNYKPIKARSKSEAKMIFVSYEKYKNLEIISVV